MRVTHLTLTNFRNYEHADVSFTPGFNALIGRNGHGKTNAVEAIHYLAHLQSHRVSSDAPLFRSATTTAIIRLRLNVVERTALLEVQLNTASQNRAQINKNKVPTRELTRWIDTVMFSPEDLLILRGEPSYRRKFIDSVYTSLYPAHRGVLTDFERVLKQRNALLKSLSPSHLSATSQSTLDAWNNQFVDLSEQINTARLLAITWLSAPFREKYSHIASADHAPTLSLINSVPTSFTDVSRETLEKRTPEASSDFIAKTDVSRETYKEMLSEKIIETQASEIQRGTTLHGPHRDDLHIGINGLAVKGYASHGETWSVALALKLAHAELLRNHTPAGDPIIILDDVFAELDSLRRKALLDAVENFEQVIITAAVEEDLPAITGLHKIFIHQGTVRESFTHVEPSAGDFTGNSGGVSPE